MKFPAKSSPDFKVCPEGNHVGICNAVIDLGLQPGSVQYPAIKHQVYIRFELAGEPIEYLKDGKPVTGPMSIGATFTASMNEKASLRKFIENMFGKKFHTNETAADFEMKNLLGRRCLLNITHNEHGDKTYANIATATPLPKGMVSQEPQHNPSLFYSLDEPDPKVFNALPEWMRKKIEARVQKELPPMPAGAPDDPGFDDDIPF